MNFLASKFNLALIVRQTFALMLVLVVVGGSAMADNGKGNNGNGKGNGGNTSAPELDLGSLSGAITLLVGGTLVMTERLRRK